MAHVAAKVGVVAVAAAVAAAIAIYESPELRRYAEDVRRRVAIALHQLGDGINPNDRLNPNQPFYNRPEDADGFMQSRQQQQEGIKDLGVDADDASRQRQREELMYWNAMMLERKEREEKEKEKPRSTSFDDFLRQDGSDEKGAFVYHTGTDTQTAENGVVRRRGGDAAAAAVAAAATASAAAVSTAAIATTITGLESSIYTNPFADHHRILDESANPLQLPAPPMATTNYTGESEADLYSTSTGAIEALLRDAAAAREQAAAASTHDSDLALRSTLERQLADDEFMTAGQEDPHSSYASIQAWAQGSSQQSQQHQEFYSPLPMTPLAPISEPEEISTGQLTPTDSISLVGSVVGDEDAASSRAGETGRYYDVLSESEGMATPASWSEVGSVVSEQDQPELQQHGVYGAGR